MPPSADRAMARYSWLVCRSLWGSSAWACQSLASDPSATGKRRLSTRWRDGLIPAGTGA